MRPFFFIIGIILFLLANLYVFQRIWRIMPANTIGRVVLIVVAVILVSSVFIHFIFRDHLSIWLNSTLYTIGASWLFVLVYLLLFNLLQDIVCLTGIVSKATALKYTRDNWAGFSLVLGFIALLMLTGYMKYKTKVRVPLDITVNKDMGNRDSLKIVAMSDLHLGYTISDSELKQWIEMINAENPDIILIAGDIIDNDVRPLKAGRYAEYLKELKVPLGVYTCAGNHEYISNISASKDFISKTGITLLQDSVALVDSCFYIVGRDDYSNRGRKPLEDLLVNIDPTKPVIVLDHQPHNLNEAEENKVDLQLSGHTHQGQFWPISTITDMMYEKSHGFLKKGESNIYVSSGIGIWGGKFRIGTQSEYVVITIKKK